MRDFELHDFELHDYAYRLAEAHGLNAIAEPAQRAHAYEQQGDLEMARTWRAIQRALMVSRGPSAS
jgi:hypothetical protein